MMYTIKWLQATSYNDDGDDDKRYSIESCSEHELVAVC